MTLGKASRAAAPPASRPPPLRDSSIWAQVAIPPRNSAPRGVRARRTAAADSWGRFPLADMLFICNFAWRHLLAIGFLNIGARGRFDRCLGLGAIIENGPLRGGRDGCAKPTRRLATDIGLAPDGSVWRRRYPTGIGDADD